MNQVWGRKESKGWPSSAPVYSITALVVALAFVILGGYCRYVFVWTPLERHYLREYFLTSLMARLGAKTDQQDILVVVTRKANRLAVDDDVVPVTTAAGKPPSRFRKTPSSTARSVSNGCANSTTTENFTPCFTHGFTTTRRLWIWPRAPLGGAGSVLVGLAFVLAPRMPRKCGRCATGDA